MASPLLAGIKISPRFAEALGMAEEKAPVVEEPKEDKFLGVNNQIKELETKVFQQLEEIKSTGYERLPGAAGKRDSDMGEPILHKLMKKHPEVFKTDPKKLYEEQQLENRMRHKYHMDEDDINEFMLPLWSTIINRQEPSPKDNYDRIPDKAGIKKKSENIDPLQLSIEKLSSMIENMGKPKTIIRDKDGRITGVA